jgi:prolipoprotein diacylglyceryltransferase
MELPNQYCPFLKLKIMKLRLYIPLFNKQIRSFHFFGVLGFLCGSLLGVILANLLGLDAGIVLLMSLTGAITFFVLVYLGKWITGTEVIVYYHHEIAIMLLCAFALWLLGLPLLPYLDITILGIATFLAFGRIGCFSVGCCHGRPSKFGVKYGSEHVKQGFTWYYQDIKLFPIQLVESVSVALAIVIGIILLFRQVVPGTILVFYTITYGMLRYVFEFFRGDPERPLFLGLSEAQWTSLMLALVTFGLSRMNWLPYYEWHFYLVLVMIGASIIVILTSRKSDRTLLHPRHISEIAEGLQLLKQEVNGFPDGYDRPVAIYTTKAGLCLSCGNVKKQENLDHCTISMQNGKMLKRRLLKRIAGLIMMLRPEAGRFDIVEKKHGVYHIVYSVGH